MPATEETEEIHASAVAYEDRGLLILGPSGSGKTTLALELMAFGVELVADDRVQLSHVHGHGMVAAAPPALRGLIELRGAGILRHPYRSEAVLLCAINLGRAAAGRMPQQGTIEIGGTTLPCLAGMPAAGPAAIMAVLRAGRLPDPMFALHPVAEGQGVARHG
ncbi:MAG: serine kinase [Pseudomonadota bacterium]